MVHAIKQEALQVATTATDSTQSSSIMGEDRAEALWNGEGDECQSMLLARTPNTFATISAKAYFPSYLGFEIDDAHGIVEQSDRLSSRAERSCSARPVLVLESRGPKWTNAFGTLECSISKARILPPWDRIS
jgi:hypothetical protein